MGWDEAVDGRPDDEQDLRGGLGQPARQDRLLLVAAGQVDDVLPPARRAHAQLLDETVRDLGLAGAVDQADGGRSAAASR